MHCQLPNRPIRCISPLRALQSAIAPSSGGAAWPGAADGAWATGTTASSGSGAQAPIRIRTPAAAAMIGRMAVSPSSVDAEGGLGLAVLHGRVTPETAAGGLALSDHGRPGGGEAAAAGLLDPAIALAVVAVGAALVGVAVEI